MNSSVWTSGTIASSTKPIHMEDCLDIIAVISCSFSADGNFWISYWSFVGETQRCLLQSRQELVFVVSDSGIHGWRQSTRLALGSFFPDCPVSYWTIHLHCFMAHSISFGIETLGKGVMKETTEEAYCFVGPDNRIGHGRNSWRTI